MKSRCGTRYLVAALVGAGVIATAGFFRVDAQPLASDPSAYLAQARCPDGSAPLPENCATPTPQQAGDLTSWRRHDWPPPRGYLASDSTELPGGRLLTTWDFGAKGHFEAARGDGGEIYAIEGDRVRIVETQDGGRPGLQHFVGPGCGGDGWVAFRTDASQGAWNDMVARLAIGATPGTCPPLNAAFTRWRRETIDLPFFIAGHRRAISVDAIIAEHFAGASIESAGAAEQFIWARGWGRVWWASYGPGPATVDLSDRCPAVPYGVSPRPDWRLHDCRLATVIVPTPAPWRVIDFGWKW